MNIKPITDGVKNIWAQRGMLKTRIKQAIPVSVKSSAKTVYPFAIGASLVMGLSGFMKNKEDGRKGFVEKHAGKIAALGFLTSASIKLYGSNVLKDGEKGILKNAKGLMSKIGVVAAGTLAVSFAAKILSKITDNISYNNQAKNRRKLANKIKKERMLQEISAKKHNLKPKADLNNSNLAQNKEINSIVAPPLNLASSTPSSSPLAVNQVQTASQKPLDVISFNYYMNMIKNTKAGS